MTIHCSPTASASHLREIHRADLAPLKIAVVNGSRRALELLGTAPKLARHTLLSLNSRIGAYSDIKRLRPSLVVLCTRPFDDDACQLLTILKLDHQTRRIPIVTIGTDETYRLTDVLDWTARCAAQNGLVVR